jgi:hypothetical protein
MKLVSLSREMLSRFSSNEKGVEYLGRDGRDSPRRRSSRPTGVNPEGSQLIQTPRRLRRPGRFPKLLHSLSRPLRTVVPL